MQQRRILHRGFLSIVCFALFGVALAAPGEDFWATKEYTRWTDDEVRKLMTNSPWAKDVTINAPAAALDPGQRPAESSSADPDNTGGGRGRRRPGGDGSGAGPSTEAIVTLILSWRSALPMRQGLVRSRLGTTDGTASDAQELITAEQENYVIVVSGVPARLGRTMQNSTDSGKSFLKVGKKPPIAARAFNVQPRTQTAEVIFLFPRSQPIVADDKEVEVVLRLGEIEAKKKFNLKDMVYNGRLEL